MSIRIPDNFSDERVESIASSLDYKCKIDRDAGLYIFSPKHNKYSTISMPTVIGVIDHGYEEGSFCFNVSMQFPSKTLLNESIYKNHFQYVISLWSKVTKIADILSESSYYFNDYID